VLPTPFIVSHDKPHNFGDVRGAVSLDGSALLSFQHPEGEGSAHVVVRWHQKKWTVLNAVDKWHSNLTLAGKEWLRELLAEDPPRIQLIDVATGAERSVAAKWAPLGRWNTELFLLGNQTVIYGGENIERSPSGSKLANSSPSETDGAIYDSSTSGVQQFASPQVPGLPDAVWQPRTKVRINGELCLFGDSAYSNSKKVSREIHDAACLNPQTASWQWRVTSRSAESCFAVSYTLLETVMMCPHRSQHRIPGNGEWPTRDVFGPYEWSLWRVTRVAKQPATIQGADTPP
jgi:hypothetical protein